MDTVSYTYTGQHTGPIAAVDSVRNELIAPKGVVSYLELSSRLLPITMYFTDLTDHLQVLDQRLLTILKLKASLKYYQVQRAILTPLPPYICILSEYCR